MTYRRVLPRDLFNEANLLKCYGRLWIALEGQLGASLSFDFEDVDGDAFEIEQRPADGSLYIGNVTLFAHGRRISLSRSLNSRGEWPLYAIDPDNDDTVSVFDSLGELTPESEALLDRKESPE